MGCVITITDEPAVGTSERDLPSLTAVREGTCQRWFARKTAAACTKGWGGQLCCSTPGPVPLGAPHWLPCWSQAALGRDWLLPHREMHFSKTSFTAREKADQMLN